MLRLMWRECKLRIVTTVAASRIVLDELSVVLAIIEELFGMTPRHEADDLVVVDHLGLAFPDSRASS